MSSHLVWSPSCTLDTIFRWDIVLDRLIVSQDDGRSWHDARKAWGDSWEQAKRSLLANPSFPWKDELRKA